MTFGSQAVRMTLPKHIGYEDDLTLKVSKTTFESQEDDLPLPIHRLLRRPLRARKMTFHSSQWPPMQANSDLPQVTLGLGLYPEAAPTSATLPDQQDWPTRPFTKS